MDNDTLIQRRIEKDPSMKLFFDKLTEHGKSQVTELMQRARIEAIKELKKEFAL